MEMTEAEIKRLKDLKSGTAEPATYSEVLFVKAYKLKYIGNKLFMEILSELDDDIHELTIEEYDMYLLGYGWAEVDLNESLIINDDKQLH